MSRKVKAKAKAKIGVLGILFLLFIPTAYASFTVNGTFPIDSHADGGTITFNEDYTIDGLEWGDDTVRLTNFTYNGSSWSLVGFGCESLSADMLIVYVNTTRIRYNVTAPTNYTSVCYIYTGGRGEPENVTGADSWGYSSPDDLVTLSETHSMNASTAETHTLDWIDLFTLVVRVLDTSDDALSGAIVSILQKDGSLSYLGTTNSTGYIDEQSLSTGDYLVQGSKEDYQTRDTLLTLDTDTNLDVTLRSIEEGITIDLPLFVFVTLPLLATVGMFTQEDNRRLIVGVGACFLWFITAVYWAITYAGTDTFQFMWVFVALGIVTGVLGVIESVMNMLNPYRNAPGFDEEW